MHVEDRIPLAELEHQERLERVLKKPREFGLLFRQSTATHPRRSPNRLVCHAGSVSVGFIVATNLALRGLNDL